MGRTTLRRSRACGSSTMKFRFSEAAVQNVRPILMGFLGLLAVSACAEHRDLSVAVGTIVTPGNTQIPLPRGEWRTLAEEKAPRYVEAYYALVEGGTLKSLVFVRTSAGVPAVSGYLPNRACVRNLLQDVTDLHGVGSTSKEVTYLHEPGSTGAGNSECLRVVYRSSTFPPPGEQSRPVYKRFYDAARALGGVPREVVLVQYTASLRFRFMNYNIYFFPERDGVRASRWSASDLGPVERTYVSEILSWAKRFQPAIPKGTLNDLP